MKKSIIWGGVITLVICTVFLFTGFKANANDSSDKLYPGAEKHQISLNEGLKLVANFRKNPQAPENQGGMFDRGAFDKILAQQDCQGIKMYWAQENGKFTVVMIGVDASGKDMINGSVMERSGFCPPFCDVTSPFVLETLAQK